MTTVTKQKRASPSKDQKSASNKKVKKNESKEQQQQHVRQRRHAETVEECKRIWNQLRLKTNSVEDNRKYMDQLMPLITGKTHQIALQHDAARVIQAALQFGTKEERTLILKELSHHGLAELSKSQYAHFTVLKLIKYCHKDEECVALILKSFRGRISKLAVHAVASRVVESLLVTLTQKQTYALRQEFYGPHFSLFAAADSSSATTQQPTLTENLARAPTKKVQTLEFVKSILNKGMTKTLYGLEYFQELFAEYVGVANPVKIRSLAATAADHAIHLLSTKAGTRVVAALVAYGTAKDRKRIMKSLKGYCRSGLLHGDAYLAILRLVQLTDDTVSIQKNILNELLANDPNKQDTEEKNESPLLELALSDCASKLFLIILLDEDSRKKLFDPYEHSLLFPNPMVEENGQEVSTSKKDPESRRTELMKHMREPLIELCTNHAEELLRSRPGALVLREVYSAFHPSSLVTAVVDICCDALKFGDAIKSSSNDQVKLFEDRDGHLAVKNLLLVDKLLQSGSEKSENTFAVVFCDRLGDRLLEVAKTNRGAFIVTALCKVPCVQKEVVAKLIKNAAKITELSKSSETTAGYTALLEQINIKT
jgi:pumilio family protein 6